MDVKTKKIIRKEIISLLRERSVLTLHGEQGVIKTLCRKFKLNEHVEAKTIADLFHSLKSYEAELIKPQFPNEIRISSKFINDLDETWKDKVRGFFLTNWITFIGLILIIVGVLVDYKLSGSGLNFWKAKGIIIAGVVVSVLGLLKR
jgi:hypothetical protein